MVAARGDGRGFEQMGNLIFFHQVEIIRDSNFALHETEAMRSTLLTDQHVAEMDALQFFFSWFAQCYWPSIFVGALLLKPVRPFC